MEKEIWKDIPKYEGLYQISNLGRIKSLSKFHRTMREYSSIGYYSKEKILTPNVAKNGYLRVSLRNNGKTKYINIHRLVAQTFIPNPNEYNYINHIDGNKLNNNVNNLEWCTQSHNAKEAFRIGLHRKYFGTDNKRSRKVIQYDLKGNFIREWDYMMKITKELGYDYTNISKCCSGIYKKSYGYIWKYKKG